MTIDSTKQKAALAAIEKTLGSGAVAKDRKTLARFGAADRQPLAVVTPTGEQLPQVLAAAAGAGGALQIVCNGDGPLGRVAHPGAIVVDLKKMNRILEVSADHAYCLVEPGVTFRQLAQYIEQQKLPLAVDLPRNVDDSIVASFQVRQAGYTPYTDHFFMQCGLEVMLADGKVVRLGMGAMAKSSCWQLLKLSYGPWVDGLFTQGCNGVVTKMGMWLMPTPPAYHPFMVTVAHEQDLGPLLDALRPLKTQMIVPNGVAVASATHELALGGKKRRDFGGNGPMAASAIEQAASASGLGFWNLYGALYGTPENVALLWGMVQGVLAAVPGAKVYTADNRGSDPVWKWRASMMRGAIGTLPGAAPGWAGGDALTVNPLSPIDGAEALQLYALSRDVVAQHGFDYVAETNAVWRAAQHEQFLAYSDAKGAAGAVACARALVEAQNAAGFGQWTAGPDVADVAHAAYGGAQGPLAVLNSRIKSALDPNALFVAA